MATTNGTATAALDAPDRDAELTREPVAEASVPPTPPSPPPDRIRTFDPTKFLTKVGPSDYLEVKWRLVWFRDVHEDGTIDTEMVETMRDDEALFKATVAVPSTGARASAYGSETYGDFRDFREKAETKAVGRALAALGFGTQFTAYELDTRVADSPVPLTPHVGRGQPRSSNGRDQQATPAGNGAHAPTPTATVNTTRTVANTKLSVAAIADLTLPIERQYENWDAAIDFAREAADATKGTVVLDDVKAIWTRLLEAATMACKKGGVNGDNLPLQRWRFYRLAGCAPTKAFLGYIVTRIEEAGAWDQKLEITAAMRDDHFKGENPDPLAESVGIMPDAAPVDRLEEIKRIVAGEPPDVPF